MKANNKDLAEERLCRADNRASWRFSGKWLVLETYFVQRQNNLPNRGMMLWQEVDLVREAIQGMVPAIGRGVVQETVARLTAPSLVVKKKLLPNCEPSGLLFFEVQVVQVPQEYGVPQPESVVQSQQLYLGSQVSKP